MPKKNKYGEYIFTDYPDFTPNLSPRDIFSVGSFGGTYYRPIYSSVTKKHYKNIHKKYPKSWFKGIPNDWLTRDFKDYDKSINKYGVKVGSTLREWEKKKWITKYNLYGWTDWYLGFFSGRRTADDERQIDRWKKTASNNGRFKRWLVNQIIKKKGKYNDFDISPAIRQTLLHWATELTLRDFNRIKNEK